MKDGSFSNAIEGEVVIKSGTKLTDVCGSNSSGVLDAEEDVAVGFVIRGQDYHSCKITD